jgi:transcription initiation factor TFIIE subunit alpha
MALKAQGKMKPVAGKRDMLTLARNVVGEPAVTVAEYLFKKKDISEFEISKALKIEVNMARSILYRLFNHNLVSYIRRKDKVKGWYISYWTLNPKGFVELDLKLRKQQLENLKERLEREQNNPNGFFLCKNACIRLDFDQASEYNFRCPECGELLHPVDNAKTVENLRVRIKELEAELAG